MRNFLIDTDTASDDAVAILMALAAPDVSVLGLTIVAGNVGIEQATRNALLTAEIAGVEVPVFAGAAAPLLRLHEHAHWFHGRDGLSDRGFPAPRRAAEREHAIDAILRLANEHPGLTLVTLGPLTNVALALARDPALAGKIGRFFCHCTICQKAYGKPFADVTFFRGDSLALPDDQPIQFHRHRPPPAMRRGTCAKCGNPVVSLLGAAPLTLAFVPSQNFPRPAELPTPDRHIFYDRRVADIADSVPKLAGYWASEASVTRLILASLFGRAPAA